MKNQKSEIEEILNESEQVYFQEEISSVVDENLGEVEMETLKKYLCEVVFQAKEIKIAVMNPNFVYFVEKSEFVQVQNYKVSFCAS